MLMSKPFYFLYVESNPNHLDQCQFCFPGISLVTLIDITCELHYKGLCSTNDQIQLRPSSGNTKKCLRSSLAALNIHFTSMSKLRCCIALIKQAEELLQTMKTQKLLKNHERSFSWSISYVHG